MKSLKPPATGNAGIFAIAMLLLPFLAAAGQYTNFNVAIYIPVNAREGDRGSVF